MSDKLLTPEGEQWASPWWFPVWPAGKGCGCWAPCSPGCPSTPAVSRRRSIWRSQSRRSEGETWASENQTRKTCERSSESSGDGNLFDEDRREVLPWNDPMIHQLHEPRQRVGHDHITPEWHSKKRQALDIHTDTISDAVSNSKVLHRWELSQSCCCYHHRKELQWISQWYLTRILTH